MPRYANSANATVECGQNRSLVLDYGYVSILGDADAASDEVSAVLRAAPDLLVMNTGVHYARELNLSSAGTALEFTLFTTYTHRRMCMPVCTHTGVTEKFVKNMEVFSAILMKLQPRPRFVLCVK